MAAGAWDRDMIFANFQAASGIEDYESCISVLEANDWDLQASLNVVLTQQENENQMLNALSRQRNSPIDVDNPPFIDLDPDPTSSLVERDCSAPEVRKINFQIVWHDRTLPVIISETETVGALKRMLEIQTGIPQAEINLEGWPSGDSSVSDSVDLSTLNLCGQTHLVLHTPTKVTVSPAEYLPCNIPAFRKSSKSSEPDSPPRVIDVDLHDDQPTCSNSPDISLTVNYLGRDFRLRYERHQTVKDVKQQLFMLTKISTRLQVWEGWPDGTIDSSRLGDLDLSQPDHFLLISSQTTNTAVTRTSMDSQRPWDSGTAGSPADTDLDEQIISDDDDDAIFDPEANQSKRLLPLLSRDSSDTSEALIQFQFQFEERYGEFHPAFFVGPLKDAIEEAAGSSAPERRPLLVYLHHDNSILTNIFCSQILCSEQFVSFVSQNFVIWPWDMTFESNRQRFVNLLVQHFGNMAANTVSKFRDQEYPLLLIVMKSKAGVEVCSVLQANTSLDELMMGLINGYEVFEQAKLVEVKSESERLEREAMKQEQDDAYHQSLAADRAKVEAEKKRAQIEVDKKYQEELDAQMKEAERMSCVEQLPEEPPKTAQDITNILFRFPGGEREARRFNGTDKLKTVFMYVTSKGFSTSEHRIVTNFPRRQLTEDSLQQTLKELKLCPQETLFVEEI